MVYLDYAANTPVDDQVLEVFCNVSRTYIANPNSPYTAGREANERLCQASEQIALLLGAKPQEVIYTSGATESNNLAIKGVAAKYKSNGKHIITTFLEHSSVTGAIAVLQNEGYEVDYLDLTKDGLVDTQHLKELLRKDTVLVSVCYVDSELGIQQDIEGISQILKDYPNCIFHVDATQAVGKIPVSAENIDLLSFAPHKFYGLNGCGVLIKKEHILLEPQIHGGASTTPYRSGTPMLGLVAASEKALSLAIDCLPERYAHVETLNKKLRCFFAGYSAVQINSTCRSTPFILNISIKGARAELFCQELETFGIYVATKSACCAPNTVSRPVYALTKDRKAALSTMRISLSHLTTADELDQFINCFDSCYKKLITK